MEAGSAPEHWPTLVTVLSIAIPALAATVLLVLTGWSFILVNVVAGLVGAVVIPIAAVTMALLHADLLAADRPASSEGPTS